MTSEHTPQKSRHIVVSPSMARREERRAFYKTGFWGVVLASLALWCTLGLAQTTKMPPSTPSQERFLQHFISNPMTPPSVPQSGTPGVATSGAPVVTETAVAAASVSASTHASSSLSAAAFRMVLGLGGILALVVAGGYGVRRFCLERPLLGKRAPLMRVLGRVSLTPKAGVALVEVPGKVLVIGITGQSVTMLSALSPDAFPKIPDVPVQSSKSQAPERWTGEQADIPFAAALQHHTRELETAISEDVDPLATISQTIRRKISGLKQL